MNFDNEDKITCSHCFKTYTKAEWLKHADELAKK